MYPANLYKKIKIFQIDNNYGALTQLIAEGVADPDYRDGRDVTLELPNSNAIEHLVNNGQSVHISSINKAICKSITLINELAEKHPTLKNPLDYIIIKHENVFKRAYRYIRSVFINDIRSTIIEDPQKFTPYTKLPLPHSLKRWCALLYITSIKRV